MVYGKPFQTELVEVEPKRARAKELLVFCDWNQCLSYCDSCLCILPRDYREVSDSDPGSNPHHFHYLLHPQEVLSIFHPHYGPRSSRLHDYFARHGTCFRGYSIPSS